MGSKPKPNPKPKKQRRRPSKKKSSSSSEPEESPKKTTTKKTNKIHALRIFFHILTGVCIISFIIVVALYSSKKKKYDDRKDENEKLESMNPPEPQTILQFSPSSITLNSENEYLSILNQQTDNTLSNTMIVSKPMIGIKLGVIKDKINIKSLKIVRQRPSKSLKMSILLTQGDNVSYNTVKSNFITGQHSGNNIKVFQSQNTEETLTLSVNKEFSGEFSLFVYLEPTSPQTSMILNSIEFITSSSSSSSSSVTVSTTTDPSSSSTSTSTSTSSVTSSTSTSTSSTSYKI